MIKKIHILGIILASVLLMSCIEERLKADDAENAAAYLQVRGGRLLNSTDPLDNEIERLRILAFNKNTGRCVSNKLYYAELNEVINHPIDDGTYDFVFLANEPNIVIIVDALNGIYEYADLESIMYPEQAFQSSVSIPMFQKLENVEVLPGQDGARVDGGEIQRQIELQLERLATRVDIVLEGEEDLTDYFKGVTFFNVPEGITLMSASNTSLGRNKTRKYTLADDAGYFTSVTPSAEQRSRGIVWVKKITRFILPFSNFTPENDDSKAITFKVDLEERHSPSCYLKIQTAGVSGASKDNYTLPYNSALLLTGVIKDPMNINIQVTPWGKEEHGWEAQNRYLNVSDISVNITDFNGARITFSSNMPVVKVLPDVIVAGSKTMKTEKVFNDLILAAGENSTTRFAYTYDVIRGEGTGYMDILLDEYNMDVETSLVNPDGRHSIFRLILSAEDENGKNSLQREITVNTSQYGAHFQGDHWNGYGYIGAFFRENEVGERIISTQLPRLEKQDYALGYWEVEVDEPYKDQVILSTTPSFDPYVGTDNPGKPEEYPVRPNEYKKGEMESGGTKINGRGRVYFRVGWRSPNPNAGSTGEKAPRYATVTLTFTQATTVENGWRPSYKLYLRQGEAADYIMNPQSSILDGPLQGKSRAYARKFSAFNITDRELKNKTEDYVGLYAKTSKRDAKFVDYPTQAGAFYQWALSKTDEDMADFIRRAYNPALPYNTDSPEGYWTSTQYWNKIPIWASSGSDEQYEYGYGEEVEVCPPGYHRPSDGYIDQVSYNGPYPNYRYGNGYVDVNGITVTERIKGEENIAFSEWRQSLWLNPWQGETIPDTEVLVGKGDEENEKIAIREKTSPAYVANKDINLLFGFYADGYYDRRPMKVQIATTSRLTARLGVGVSINSPSVAYRGTLVYNPENNASTFFPAAGRRLDRGGYLEYVGETGYYWSSSTGPNTATAQGSIVKSVWSVEIAGWNPGHLHILPTFGYSIRCVKDEMSSN